MVGAWAEALSVLIVSWVFVSFVVSWEEEWTAMAQRPRRDAKEEEVSEDRFSLWFGLGNGTTKPTKFHEKIKSWSLGGGFVGYDYFVGFRDFRGWIFGVLVGWPRLKRFEPQMDVYVRRWKMRLKSGMRISQRLSEHPLHLSPSAVKKSKFAAEHDERPSLEIEWTEFLKGCGTCGGNLTWSRKTVL